MSDTLRQPLLIEIGCEEIPAAVAPAMASHLCDSLVALLDDSHLAHGPATWLGTPRRLTVHIADVASGQADRVEELTGPPVKVAFDAEGQPTRAGQGFARGQGVDPAELFTIDTPKGPYAALRKQIVGRPSGELLAEALPGLLRATPQPKRMRWGEQREGFVRPLHWIVALLGEDLIDCSFAGVRSGRSSQGHRFLGGAVELADADLLDYIAVLEVNCVLVEPARRSAAILSGARALAASIGGTLVEDAELLAEVTWLVEWPSPLLGRFDADFLDTPEAVTILTLKAHQRLFTIRGAQNELLDRFVATANTLSEASRETIAAGNARVVAARLSDALFFYRNDLKRPLESFNETLAAQVYLQGLGSVRDKVERVVEVAGTLADGLGIDGAACRRAATLCKADLASSLVFEFTELQGQIGEHYALAGGDSAVVAAAIREHYLPRFAGDDLPQSDVGAAVAVADKLDAIVGCFGIGMIPTGTQDPYALRRQSLGVLHILAARGWTLPLTRLVTLAVQGLSECTLKTAGEPLVAQVLAFLRGRLESLHRGAFAADLVDAVLTADFEAVPSVEPRLLALSALRQGDGFEPLAAAFKRVANIVRKADEAADATVVEALLVEPAERQLWAEVVSHEADLQALLAAGQWADALGRLAGIRPTVDAFFDSVMVMADDAALRSNRLALMRRTASLFDQIADFSRIQAVREPA